MAGKPASKLGDKQSGHSCFPPTASATCSANVKINNKGALRVSDQFIPHCCPKSGCHPPVQSTGSSKVIVNGRMLARLGDKTACGAVVMTGSSNVIAG